jgi:hypothetical protein
MFPFILSYFQKIYFSPVKKLIYSYEVLHKAVFNQRLIRECRICFINKGESDFFTNYVYVFLSEATTIRNEYLS